MLTDAFVRYTLSHLSQVYSVGQREAQIWAGSSSKGHSIVQQHNQAFFAFALDTFLAESSEGSEMTHKP